MANLVQNTNTLAEKAKMKLVAFRAFLNATEMGFISPDGVKFKGNQEFTDVMTSIFGKTKVSKYALGGSPTIECDLMTFDTERMQLIYNYGRTIPFGAGSAYKGNGKPGCKVLAYPWTFYPVYCDENGTSFDADGNNPFAIYFPQGTIKDDLEFDAKNDDVFTIPLNIEGMADITNNGTPYFIGNRPLPDYMALATKVLTSGAGYTSIPTITAVGGATFVANIDLATGKLRDVGISNPGTSASIVGWQNLSFTGGGATTQATAQVFFG
jgi:hypothetical protein